MHEYHIVEGVVNQIINKAQKSNAIKVTRVSLVMGELSGLDESSVRMYFENLSKDTILDGAELVINPAQTKLRCPTCDMVFDYKKGEFNCPHCGNLGVASQKSGKDFFVDNIEIETK